MDLSKQVFLLQKLDGKDIGDVIRDEYDNNSQSTTAPGLDVGVIWAADRYRLGATLYNLNQPSFDYGPVGENCQTPRKILSPAPIAKPPLILPRCAATLKPAKHTKTAYLGLDGTYYWQSNAWASAALDLTAYDDFVGTEQQWLTISAHYAPSTHWLPNVRSGLQKISPVAN